ncbi:MAG: aspartate kinase [Polyangiaceae bacterium]|nr:aspartate kinase [Polyangiaceae bacterium]
MNRIACKFGGTSLADAAQMRKVKAIVEADARRQIIVPSAPGKRTKEDPKVTDLLYLCHEMAEMHADLTGPFGMLRQRFVEIEAELGLAVGIADAIDAFLGQVRAGCSRDHAASRGEYFSGLLLAAFLGAEFVDPHDHIIISSTGRVDPITYQRLGQRLVEDRRYVIPGFYGRGPNGDVKTFSRGGSDISGAIVARAAGAELYENWTDVSGLLMADPRIIDSPRPMAEVTYREIRELSYMGATVLHDEAILPVREIGTPICIKNTNRPDHPGTRIVARLSEEEDKGTEIAGIAGKQGFSMICVEKSLMNAEVGFAFRLLGIFQRRGISIEHCPSSIDGINVIVEQKYLGDAAPEVIEEIRRMLDPDSVTLVPDLALVAVVGEGMIHSVGIAAKVFAALRDAGVNVRVINQGASEVNIIVGVHPDDFQRALRSIYAAFVA